MGRRLIIPDNLDDPLNPLVLDGAAFAAAARDPLAIGMLMVDQVWAEGMTLQEGACMTSGRATSTVACRPLKREART
jgi:hypothetical protein